MRPSIAPRGVLLERNSGSWYFEVLVVTPGNAYVGIGDAFYTGNSRDAQGIGDDAHSWGYSGYLCKRKHDKVTQPFGFAWKTGDVVGCLIDTDSGQLSFTLNGSSESPLGVAFENIYANGRVGGVVPIVSFDSAFTFRMNLGNFHCATQPQDPASVRSPVGFSGKSNLIMRRNRGGSMPSSSRQRETLGLRLTVCTCDRLAGSLHASSWVCSWSAASGTTRLK